MTAADPAEPSGQEGSAGVIIFLRGALTWRPKPSQESAEARRPGYLGKAEARSQRAGTADTAHEQTVSGNREEG